MILRWLAWTMYRKMVNLKKYFSFFGFKKKLVYIQSNIIFSKKIATKRWCNLPPFVSIIVWIHLSHRLIWSIWWKFNVLAARTYGYSLISVFGSTISFNMKFYYIEMTLKISKSMIYSFIPINACGCMHI